MSNYQVIEYLKENVPDTGKTCIVALVQKTGEEQPFRVVCENFSSMDDVKEVVADWIKTADEDDERAAMNYEEEQKQAKIDATVNELNQEVAPLEEETEN